MIKTKSLQSLLRHVWLMGAVLALLFPSVASAFVHSKDSQGNPEIIRQLGIVRDTLAVLDGKLDVLDGKLDALAMELDAQGGDLDFLVEDAESVEKDIKIDSTVCFSYTNSTSLGVKIEGEIGAGWDLGIIAKIKGKPNINPLAHKLALSSKLCIKVPLHKVASDPLVVFDDTAAFDQLVADLASGPQVVVPAMAALYSLINPRPIIPRVSQGEDSSGLLGAAMQATANVLKAATGTDIMTGDVGMANPAMLLRPNELLEPILSDPVQAFADDIPVILAGLAVDPCGLLTGGDSQLLGDISVAVCDDVDAITDFVLDILDPLGILH